MNSKLFLSPNLKSYQAMATAFEPPLPWANMVETSGNWHIASHLKEVKPWKSTPVKCMPLATDKAIDYLQLNTYKAGLK